MMDDDLPEDERPMSRFVVGIPLVLRFLNEAGGAATKSDIRAMLLREAPEIERRNLSGQIMSEMKARGLADNPERATWVLTAKGRATLMLSPEFERVEKMVDDLARSLERGSP
jgi:hypothetical protein